MTPFSLTRRIGEGFVPLREEGRRRSQVLQVIYPEQTAYVNVAVNPDLERRAIAALQKGSEPAIDEFVLENRYLKVVKAVIKGWLQPND